MTAAAAALLPKATDREPYGPKTERIGTTQSLMILRRGVLVNHSGGVVLRTGPLDSQRRRWESNPLETALQAVALPSGSSATFSSVLARNRTWSSTFAGSRAISGTLQGRSLYVTVQGARGTEEVVGTQSRNMESVLLTTSSIPFRRIAAREP